MFYSNRFITLSPSPSSSYSLNQTNPSHLLLLALLRVPDRYSTASSPIRKSPLSFRFYFILFYILRDHRFLFPCFLVCISWSLSDFRLYCFWSIICIINHRFHLFFILLNFFVNWWCYWPSNCLFGWDFLDFPGNLMVYCLLLFIIADTHHLHVEFGNNLRKWIIWIQHTFDQRCRCYKGIVLMLSLYVCLVCLFICSCWCTCLFVHKGVSLCSGLFKSWYIFLPHYNC